MEHNNFQALSARGPSSAPGVSPSAATPSPTDEGASSTTLLKPPAGAILECLLGAAAVAAVVIVGCVFVTRKVHASRARALRSAGASRSSLTVAALSGPGAGAVGTRIPLSMRPEAVRGARESKPDGAGEVDGRCGLETARE